MKKIKIKIKIKNKNKNIANFLYLMDIFLDFRFCQKLNTAKYLSS